MKKLSKFNLVNLDRLFFFLLLGQATVPVAAPGQDKGLLVCWDRLRAHTDRSLRGMLHSEGEKLQNWQGLQGIDTCLHPWYFSLLDLRLLFWVAMKQAREKRHLTLVHGLLWTSLYILTLPIYPSRKNILLSFAMGQFIYERNSNSPWVNLFTRKL